MSTPFWRYLDVMLGREGLDAWVAEGRADGLSWAALAAELSELTGANVQENTLRRWYV